MYKTVKNKVKYLLNIVFKTYYSVQNLIVSTMKNHLNIPLHRHLSISKKTP